MRNPESSSPWKRLVEYPPPLVRLFAKYPGSGRACTAIPDAEVAIRSGLSYERVRQISRLPNWDGVSVGEMLRFFTGCGFDPTNSIHRHRVAAYEISCNRSKEPFHYLRRSPKWESEFLPLIQMLPQILNPESPLLARRRQACLPA